MTEWRFDQGRLDYFQIDEIRRIACALASVDGIRKPTVEADALRGALANHTSLPFLPTAYTVWRNYGRVFKCMMLVAEIDGRIQATDLCKRIAENPSEFDADDYLAHFVRHFYYASPIFQGYTDHGIQIFPAVAIVKFLISEFLVRGKDYVSLEEIATHLIANEATGLEDLKFYGSLRANPKGKDIDLRQPRELVKFVSQFSFLKWDNPKLYLEVKDKEELLAIETALKPVLSPRNADPELEIFQMGNGFAPGGVGDITLQKIETLEEEFTEGKKVRVTHLRAERSSKLREIFFATANSPEVCNMCTVDTAKRYPWTPHVIELHHLLPLSSPIRVEGGKTSLKDLVGLCPSCHRATHRFYTSWFKKHGLSDFRSYAEAQGVYDQARQKIVI